MCHVPECYSHAEYFYQSTDFLTCKTQEYIMCVFFLPVIGNVFTRSFFIIKLYEKGDETICPLAQVLGRFIVLMNINTGICKKHSDWISERSEKLFLC